MAVAPIGLPGWERSRQPEPGKYAAVETCDATDPVDEYRILVHPVVLGKGRSFLDDGVKRVDLDLVDTTVISGRVSVLTYQPVR